MARGNLPACLAISLVHEGGFTKEKRDPGNWTGGKVDVGVLKGTKYGIAANSFPNLDIEKLTIADVVPIYRTKYWDKVRGDDLPYGVDLTVNDYGINSGPSRAVKELQRAVGVSPDGRFGDGTLAAIGKVNGGEIVKRVSARRLSFVRGLSTFKTFGKGWSRRIADVEAKGVAMWLKFGTSASATSRHEILDGERRKANVKAGEQKTLAGGAGGGGAAAGGGDVAMNGEVSWIIIGLIVALVVIAIVMVVKARQNRDRANAYGGMAVAAASEIAA